MQDGRRQSVHIAEGHGESCLPALRWELCGGQFASWLLIVDAPRMSVIVLGVAPLTTVLQTSLLNKTIAVKNWVCVF